MRFAYASWGTRAPDGAVACDGLVAGARLDLSHWSRNKTPAFLKADTSVEIALNFARARSAFDVELAVNNHFDTDGVLAVWTLLRPELALEHASLITAAAEAGDFDEYPSDVRGLLLEAAISKLSGDRSDPAAYALVLPMLDTLVPSIVERSDLWGDTLEGLEAGRRWVERGDVAIEKVGRVALYTHAPAAAELPGPLIAQLRPPATDRILLAMSDGTAGYKYRYELPRYAWADTVVRPKIELPKRGIIARTLGRQWIVKGRRGMTGIAYSEVPIETSTPRELAARLAELA